MTNDNLFYTRAYKMFGSMRKAAKHLGIPETTFRRRFHKERRENPLSSAIHPKKKSLKKGKKKFVITSAQNDTQVHYQFFDNLVKYSDHIGAELIVIPITYILPENRKKPVSYDSVVEPYLENDRLELCNGLHVCSEVDILPTAVHPLSGLDEYSKENWGIFPHPKIQLKSVATPVDEYVKMNMTTGSCTVPNYIKRKAGLKAIFHHSYAAVVVEVDYDNDEFWIRHIIADENGSFYDLGCYVSNGDIEDSYDIDVMILGDIHAEKVDEEALEETIKFMNLFNVKKVVLHDLIDFRSRNHHSRDSFFFRAGIAGTEEDLVENDFEKAVAILEQMSELVDEVIIAASNHHDAFTRWLEEVDFKNDPVNSKFYIKEMARYLDSIDNGCDDDPFTVTLKNKLIENGVDTSSVRFLKKKDSYVVHGIEIGQHGHLGPNGARGSVSSFSKLSRKMIMGHTHSAEINGGAWSVGTTSKLYMDYNDGPSSWSHTHCVVYPNGQRCLITRSRTTGKFFMT